jgi:hypothetical protein
MRQVLKQHNFNPISHTQYGQIGVHGLYFKKLHSIL